jgi:type IV secretory pathway protease TraF
MSPGESTTQSVGGGSPQPAPAIETTINLSATQTIAAPTSRSLTRLLWVVVAALAGLVVLAGVRLWMIDGLVLRRVSIDGPSMAPGLCGAHYGATCGDCGFPFRCDARDVPASGLVVCPNCGYAKNQLAAVNLRPADAVLLDRWPLLWRGPRIGEVVAARLPDAPDKPVIKRVAALPGERLEIREGDLWVSGRLVRKSLRELHEVRLLVHDNDFQPKKTTGLPARWRPERTGSGWQTLEKSFHFEAAAGGEIDWLRYHHWRSSQSAAPRTKAVPILDNDSYNQNLSRQMNDVIDVMLTCRVEATGEGQLALLAIDGSQRFEATLDTAARRILLTADGASLVERPLPANFTGRPAAIEFGLCDEQVILAIDGRTIIVHPYARATGSHPEVLHPLAIGASGLRVTVSNLQVWRDIYHLEPLGTPRPWQADAALASGEFALLGDNPPASDDSRHWPGSGGVPRGKLLGRVTRPFWAEE